MGKYKKGILGNFRGKVGSVVGSSWQGVHYLKSIPDFGDYTPTAAQLNVRFKLAMVTTFLKRLKPLINVGYQQFNKGITPMNVATSYHLKNAVTGTSSANYAIDYTKVMFSDGELSAGANPGVAVTTAAKLDFSWDNDALPTTTGGTDRATVLAYNVDKGKFTMLPSAAARSAEAYVLQLPPDWGTDQVHAWISFVSVDGKEVSNSSYIGEFTVL
ncbi:hypothetical protein ABIE26_000850 [Pedobacter africanus]|uniref:Uncharacterized protein n=1 Tax=Pedobacter africanus TaxID=151894 RepID=A0ACC6KU49_9SPHI|nr:DUF6266 family protein [Pedobacter africanus]MDR6782662.1 hypothetical protein [Pedobacter africanus]